MEITYRFVIMSFANSETGIVSEPRIHPYLLKGRQIMIEINHNPIISWFKANDGSIKCESRLGILPNGGDTIKLLGKKEAMNNLTIPESPDTNVDKIDGATEKLLTMRAELDKLIATQTKSQGVSVSNEAQFDGVIIDETEDIEPF